MQNASDSRDTLIRLNRSIYFLKKCTIFYNVKKLHKNETKWNQFDFEFTKIKASRQTPPLACTIAHKYFKLASDIRILIIVKQKPFDIGEQFHFCFWTIMWIFRTITNVVEVPSFWTGNEMDLIEVCIYKVHMCAVEWFQMVVSSHVQLLCILYSMCSSNELRLFHGIASKEHFALFAKSHL